MTDTQETLQSALDDLTRRVAAFEKVQKAEVEPPMLTESEWKMLSQTYHVNLPTSVNIMHCNAAARLRYLESAHAADQAELARLREGLKVQPRDVPPELLRSWTDGEYAGTSSERMALEVQRHRALLDGAK